MNRPSLSVPTADGATPIVSGETIAFSRRTPAASLSGADLNAPPPHYLKRVARSVLLRAAVRGRLSWFVVLPLLARLEGGAA